MKLFAVYLLFFAQVLLGHTFCLETILKNTALIPQTVLLLGPTSGTQGLIEIAERSLPAETQLMVLMAPGSAKPDSLHDRTLFSHMPSHNSLLTHQDSIFAGLNSLYPQLSPLTKPLKIIVGSEYVVDWGNELKKALENPNHLNNGLAPYLLVSKSAVRKILEKEKIPNLIWPKIFDETNQLALMEYISKNQNARLAVKYDSSSGMNGLQFCQANEVLDIIQKLQEHDNKHHRSNKIIVEEFIDSIPLPAGQKWKEVAFDAVAYTLDKTYLKFFSAWIYEKDKNKMYLSDTILSPNSLPFQNVRTILEKIVNTLGYKEGGLHFEVYVAVDSEGRVVHNTPVILGDPNFRFGGNNKFASLLHKHKVFSHLPNELLLLGSLQPELLHQMMPNSADETAKVLVLSFPDAPEVAKISEDPSKYLQQLRSLPTYQTDTIPWTSENYQKFIVGHGKELPDTVEVLLIGDPDKIEKDEKEIRRIEKELSQHFKKF
jgi:hypothetical protein